MKEPKFVAVSFDINPSLKDGEPRRILTHSENQPFDIGIVDRQVKVICWVDDEHHIIVKSTLTLTSKWIYQVDCECEDHTVRLCVTHGEKMKVNRSSIVIPVKPNKSDDFGEVRLVAKDCICFLPHRLSFTEIKKRHEIEEALRSGMSWNKVRMLKAKLW